jgi:23S rRNA (guanine745-N1)-methyltransferase
MDKSETREPDPPALTASRQVTLLCPVRGCGEPLAPAERALRCPRGHSFDLARSGYCNLLQPQDRRSRRPGDSRAAAAARRRLFDRGLHAQLVAAIAGWLDGLGLPPAPPMPAVLDVGCGEGSILGALAARRPLEAHGVDLSAPALDLAARRFPAATWVAANADRRLPYPAGSFAVALSITAGKHGPELHRVLSGDGWLLLAVPGADDLIELRQAVLGRGDLRERLGPALAGLQPHFELAGRATVRYTVEPDAAALDDLLSATYRGARHGAAERRQTALGRQMTVTMSRELAWLRRRAAVPDLPPG